MGVQAEKAPATAVGHRISFAKTNTAISEQLSSIILFSTAQTQCISVSNCLITTATIIEHKLLRFGDIIFNARYNISPSILNIIKEIKRFLLLQFFFPHTYI